ncbi:MAG TPA: cyclodeaminase/cyclohydrolase family protein [Actinomycetota bacterium]|nr:cyclodeaminase/cyclohydrolase family protein [Actinomycetota bacterium]
MSGPRLGEHPWLEPYAAPTAVPGGGSAAAVAGALGCALLAMAARVGARKADGERAETLGRLAASADALRAELLVREAADADAYERMVATARAARATTGDERAASRATRAVVEAALVPLGTAELAARGLGLAAELAACGLARTASDQLTAVHLLLAALEGGLATVAVNLPGLPDAERDRLSQRAAELAEARRAGREAAALLGPLLA